MTTGGSVEPGPVSARYRAIVLSNTTLGVFIAGINQSIVIISLPAIFRGIHLDPLQPSNIGYLLWLLQGYMVVTAVLVVTLGRIGDMFGRVRMYNAGFAIFTAASIALAAMPFSGAAGASTLIALRIVQGVGGALLMANSTAILTDAFPPEKRGFAIGFNIIAAVAATFIGLIAGGLLADIDWRLVFLVSVPFGLFGTVWAYLKLHDSGVRKEARIDYAGNITFALGLVLVMIGLTYGLMPYGGHSMGWLNPSVDAELLGGIALLAMFVFIESRVVDPMFHIQLFRIRSFFGATLASLLASMGRGGLQFMLILWLQGIWLPLHGYSFSSTPLWAGPGPTAAKVAHLPAVATLFAAFLGVNPMKQLLGPHVLGQASVHAPVITGKSFFPSVIAAPFHHGLVIAFAASAGLCALAAAFSWWAGDCRPTEEERADALAHESFVDGHSTAPIGGLDGALPDVVEV